MILKIVGLLFNRQGNESQEASAVLSKPELKVQLRFRLISVREISLCVSLIQS